MTSPFRVFKGPGNRLVAVSERPVGANWILKSGEQGKRLRSSTIPSDRYQRISAVESDHVPDDYDLIYEGKIDAYGNPVGRPSTVCYWEAQSVDLSRFAELLRVYVDEMRSFGVSLRFTDDMSGTRVRIGQTEFGLARAPAPGTIDLKGNGASAICPSSSADLLCLIALLSGDLPISVVDAEGTSLTRNQVVSRCCSSISEPMSSFLESHGLGSLATTLRKISTNAVRF